MKDILIICQDAEVCRLIKHKVGGTTTVHTTPDVSGKWVDTEHPYDLVFFDALQHDDLAGTRFEEIRRHFSQANPLVQFVALAPKEQARKAVMAVRQGASDYLTYPIDGAEIDLVMESIQQNLSKEMELEYLRDKFWKSDWLEIIHTHNPAMRGVLDRVRSVAPTIATVLLLGDTGTGKGLMARLIHRHSHRAEGPFVSVHCGAIPETLIESELFGHEKGAFTGAERRKIGKFEMARGGTIFLDEIGTVTPAAQIRLLQVLQDGTFDRLGGDDTIATNARIIAATNADLPQMAEAGAFRKDLLYRLNVFPIDLPPLKARREDIPHLVSLFLANLNNKYGKAIMGLQNGLMEALQGYHWPGNLRELENLLERAYILEQGGTLKFDSFPETLVAGSKIVRAIEEATELPLAAARQNAVDAFERSYLTRLLTKNGGRISATATSADVTPRQLRRLLTKHGLDKRGYKA
jgi:DNA-binding NtrC family response regulator